MVSLDFNKDASPLYSQIKKIIKSKIEEGEYKEGETIPSEKELEDIFKVSRITVRKAILELVTEGYLVRQRGKGTVVKNQKIIEENLSNIMTFTEEMKAKDIEPSTQYAKIEKVIPDSSIASFMNIDDDIQVYKIIRVRCADGEPIVIFETYINSNLNLPMDNAEYYGSLYELIKKNNNTEVYKAKEHIEAVIADEEITKFLDIKIGDPILKTIRKGYDSKERPIEYTECFYRADKYRYYVELYK